MQRNLPEKPVVRVVFPFGPVVKEAMQLSNGIKRLEEAGCTVHFDDSRTHTIVRDYLSGNDKAREQEIIDALNDDACDIIWVGAGGAGGARLLDPILKAAQNVAPKIVIGNDEATSILNVLAAELGWNTWHAPCVTALGGMGRLPLDLANAFAMLRGEQREVTFRGNRKGSVISGKLMGGDLPLISCLAGTAHAIKPTEPVIWFFEDQNEPPQVIDRHIQQLRAAGFFNTAVAIWMGDLSQPSCQTKIAHEGIVEDLAPTPLVANAPAGHNGISQMLPIGAHVELNVPAGVMRILD